MFEKYTDQLIEFASKERFYIGASLLRIVLGLLILYFYIIHFSQRHFLFSDYGIINFDSDYLQSSLSIYNLSSSLLVFDMLYIIGIIVCILYIIGLQSRIVGLLQFIFFYSLYLRFAYVGDGGDNLISIILFFLMFANTTRYFSISFYMKGSKIKKNNHTRKIMLSIIQNFVVLFCVMQVCIVYVTSAFFQIMGESWNNGTALYYVSQVKTLSTPLLENFATNHVYIVVIVSYTSIFIKLAFPLLILNKKTKLAGVVALCSFHIGIAVGMGLYSFSLAMIAVELLIFTDKEYMNGLRKARHLNYKLISLIRTRITNFSTKNLGHQKMIVFFDSWCPLCKKAKSSINKLDYFDLVEFVSFRDTSIQKKYKLNLDKVSVRMHSKTKNRKMVSGIDSFIDISKRIVFMWPLYPCLLLSKSIGIGEYIYDLIASKRTIIPVNQCEDTGCEITANRKTNS